LFILDAKQSSTTTSPATAKGLTAPAAGLTLSADF
jgi:hypothetical protein